MRRRTKPDLVDHGLELLLSYNDRILYLGGGYHLKFEISRTKETEARPHGLSYSFTLHDQRNRRVLGYDNAHTVKPLGRNARAPKTHDHWHRDAHDKGRPYDFIDAPTMVKDFFGEAERYLADRGIELDVIGEGKKGDTDG